MFGRATAPLLVSCVALALGAGTLVFQCGGSWSRAFWIGQPLLELHMPRSGDVVSQGGLQVHVVYPHQAKVAPGTFRCELNGEDVTDRMRVLADGGANGAIYPLREGVNRLRVAVFGESLWGGWIEDVVEVEIRARPLALLDRA